MAGVDGYGPESYGDAFADVYDEWYADVSPAADTARFVVDHLREHQDGPVVELGSGTGRLAAPMRAAGLTVIGLDASAAMLHRSRNRDPNLPVVAGDMADLPIRRRWAAGVLIAYNTLFNLPTLELQQAALAECARVLRPGGLAVIETFVPGDGAGEATDRVDVVRMDVDLVVLRVSRNDPDRQTVAGHHVELRDGEPVRLRPWLVRYATPDQLDTMAADAGLRLAERCADWSGTPADGSEPAVVSVYRLEEGGG